MTSMFRNAAASALVALTLAASAAATPASAHWRGGWGVPVAAGFLGALALGSIAAQSHPYYGYDADYAPAYYPPAPRCWIERQPISDEWGNYYGTRRVRVCD